MQARKFDERPGPSRRLSFQYVRKVRFGLWPAIMTLLLVLAPPPGLADAEGRDGAGPPGPDAITTIPIGYLKQEVDRPIPLSRLNIEPDDLGIAGAAIALKDNNTTGRFTKQTFALDVERVPAGGDAVQALMKLVASGHRFILVDAPAEILLRLSDAVKEEDVLLFNIAATDVNLRQEDCRANVLHTAPDRAMLADALAQYLVWKKWPRWLVAKGVFPEDLAYLDALRRAAKRFGGTIVEEREYKETPGARRSDTGHQQIQRQMPVFTQGAPSYDVVVVADEKEVFGPYLPFRTWDARPVAGTAGLKAVSWHPAHEQWGATQMQNRFQRSAKRFMLPLDYQAWVAVRAIGEGASRRSRVRRSPSGHGTASSGNRSSSPGPICRCRHRRKRASCTSAPGSTRSASIGPRANASSND